MKTELLSVIPDVTVTSDSRRLNLQYDIVLYIDARTWYDNSPYQNRKLKLSKLNKWLATKIQKPG